jgi:hypothetical protein
MAFDKNQTYISSSISTTKFGFLSKDNNEWCDHHLLICSVAFSQGTTVWKLVLIWWCKPSWLKCEWRYNRMRLVIVFFLYWSVQKRSWNTRWEETFVSLTNTNVWLIKTEYQRNYQRRFAKQIDEPLLEKPKLHDGRISNDWNCAIVLSLISAYQTIFINVAVTAKK